MKGLALTTWAPRMSPAGVCGCACMMRAAAVGPNQIGQPQMAERGLQAFPGQVGEIFHGIDGRRAPCVGAIGAQCEDFLVAERDDLREMPSRNLDERGLDELEWPERGGAWIGREVPAVRLCAHEPIEEGFEVRLRRADRRFHRDGTFSRAVAGHCRCRACQDAGEQRRRKPAAKTNTGYCNVGGLPC